MKTRNKLEGHDCPWVHGRGGLVRESIVRASRKIQREQDPKQGHVRSRGGESQTRRPGDQAIRRIKSR